VTTIPQSRPAGPAPASTSTPAPAVPGGSPGGVVAAGGRCAWACACYFGTLAHMLPALVLISLARLAAAVFATPARLLGVLVLTGVGLLWVCPARAQDGTIMSVIQRAIDSPSGAVSFTFGPQEPWVRVMRHQMETSGPVTIAAKVVRRYQQEGCARIHARFLVHEAAVNQAGKFEDLVFAINFNTCRDGEPPMETLDLATIQELTSPAETTPVMRMPRIVPLDDPNAPARDPAAPRRPAAPSATAAAATTGTAASPAAQAVSR